MTSPSSTSRPTGILSRLTRLSVALTIFSFAAVALAIFWPDNSEDLFKREVRLVHGHLESLCSLISRTDSASIHAILSHDNISSSLALYDCNSDGSPHLVAVASDDSPSGESPNESGALPTIDPRMVEHLLSFPDTSFVPIVYSGDYSTYYHVFEIEKGRPAILVATLEHGLIVADRPWLTHTLFLLFLTTLLMVLSFWFGR